MVFPPPPPPLSPPLCLSLMPFHPLLCLSTQPPQIDLHQIKKEENEPASKYWSFSLAVEHGFIDTEYPHDACIHPPATDWDKPLVTDGDAADSSDGDEAELAAVGAPSAAGGGGEVVAGSNLAVRICCRRCAFVFIVSLVSLLSPSSNPN